MQWAQNSTHVFLAVKFAQRWNAPGALEVENETVAFSACCFNFTAFGEHSFIRRRYLLSFELFRSIIAASSSWFMAAAGRVTITMAKAAPGNWPRLMQTEAQPKNLGIWRDMRDKWQSDLGKFPLEGEKEKKKKRPEAPPAASDKKANAKSEKQKGRRKAAEESEDDEEARDRENDFLGECEKSAYKNTPVAELCGKIFREVVETPQVPQRRWLVEMYSSTGTGDQEAMRKLMPVWKRLAEVFPSMAPGGRVGAVDCGNDKEFCKKLGVSKLPQIRRFIGTSAGDLFQGDLDASMEDIATWGSESGKEEL
jgi:hypothetical protein